MNSSGQLVGSPVNVLVSATAGAHLESIQHLTLLDKLSLWASWAAAAGIFLTLGWMAMAPDDPYGAVSLLMRGNAMSMWLQSAGLAMVTSAIAATLVGRSLPYAGPFAAALGLAAVSLRGQTAESLLIAARTSGPGTSSLAMRMGVESLAWFGIVILAFVAGEGITRWCFSRSAPGRSTIAAAFRNWPTPAFAAAALVIGLLAFNILGAGMHSREIRHTQIFFVVGASIWLGCYFAFRLVPVLGIRWYALAALLMPVVGYIWASMQNDSSTLPVSIPPSNYLRVLPIQFVSVGVAAAISAYWTNLNHFIREYCDDDSGSGSGGGG